MVSDIRTSELAGDGSSGGDDVMYSCNLFMPGVGTTTVRGYHSDEEFLLKGRGAHVQKM
jgi:hypothetical protein